MAELEVALAEQTERAEAEAEDAMRLEAQIQRFRESEERARSQIEELEDILDDNTQQIHELERENEELLEVIKVKTREIQTLTEVASAKAKVGMRVRQIVTEEESRDDRSQVSRLTFQSRRPAEGRLQQELDQAVTRL